MDRLLSLPEVGKIVVAVDDQQMFARSVSSDIRVTTVTGSTTRSRSVLNALRHLAINDNPRVPVLVHDAARPCVRADEISKLIVETAASTDGGLLAIPVSDTLKRASEDGTVHSSVDRTGAWRAVTPQLFRLDVLIDALDRSHKAGVAVTDESSAMEYCGYSPRLVSCSEDNIKITRAADLVLAQAILEAQERE